jgi:hypothetical protein
MDNELWCAEERAPGSQSSIDGLSANKPYPVFQLKGETAKRPLRGP